MQDLYFFENSIVVLKKSHSCDIEKVHDKRNTSRPEQRVVQLLFKQLIDNESKKSSDEPKDKFAVFYYSVGRVKKWYDPRGNEIQGEAFF